MAEEDSLETSSWLFPSSWFSWRPTSMAQLAQAERKILQTFLKKSFNTQYVKLPRTQNKLWTLTVNENQYVEKLPIVLVHGMGGGIGLWAQNIDHLAHNRTLYAFDLLGFGRSSRPKFSYKPEIAEQEFVESIEEWRQEMNIDQMILLGHSLGAYVSSSYCIKYPDKVKHLILVDAWGFPEKPPADQQRRIPMWIRAIATVLKPFNPLAVLRIAGPWGPGLVKRFRPDLQNKFSHTLDDDTVFDYIYHCNAQTPSGEAAFKTLNTSFGWAKNPMIDRVTDIRQDIPITMVYGSKSWVDSNTGYHVKYLRNESYVDVAVVRAAGHHVYADKPDPFNQVVLKICDAVDNNTLPKFTRNRDSSKSQGNDKQRSSSHAQDSSGKTSNVDEDDNSTTVDDKVKVSQEEKKEDIPKQLL